MSEPLTLPLLDFGSEDVAKGVLVWSDTGHSMPAKGLLVIILLSSVQGAVLLTDAMPKACSTCENWFSKLHRTEYPRESSEGAGRSYVSSQVLAGYLISQCIGA